VTELSKSLEHFKDNNNLDQTGAIQEIARLGEEAGYTVADIDTARPWGGFVRFDYKDGDTFVHEFFPGVDPVEARLGNSEAELSPKILYVLPEQRLSWQRHGRRAERWVFLTDGYYHKSNNPAEMGDPIFAEAGTVVQFEAGECHRLVGNKNDVTYVAEIWQHTEADNPSDESDIERLSDDYSR
jgi:mannose-6-phosphate isomerase-like protein (cupin superfamily)